MEMIRVRSTAIVAAGYDPNTRRMKIKFEQGHTYDFCGVPAHIFESFMGAGSKGTYYNNHIKNRYRC